MEKYIEIINIVVPKHSDRTILIKQLDKIQSNPEDYIDNNDRLLDLSDDYLWLGLIDLLITKGYAFEIDWKDDYNTAKRKEPHKTKDKEKQKPSLKKMVKEMRMRMYLKEQTINLFQKQKLKLRK